MPKLPTNAAAAVRSKRVAVVVERLDQLTGKGDDSNPSEKMASVLTVNDTVRTALKLPARSRTRTRKLWLPAGNALTLIPLTVIGEVLPLKAIAPTGVVVDEPSIQYTPP